ncbi:prepilin-type N-terminal cleavage/methylation domain-containing protein [Rhodanobacter umsongensis]
MSRRTTFHPRQGRYARRRVRASRGFTMIELMVAMLLGLIVIGGVISVFLANQQSYRTNQALSDVEGGSRAAFELMARDIRNAGLDGCDNSGRVSDVLKNSPAGGGTAWWANWGNALIGYGTGSTIADPAITTAAGAVPQVGTDSLMLLGGDSVGLSILSDAEPAATFTLNETTANLQNGDVIIACDPDHAAITQITSYAGGSPITLAHVINGGSPGNCTTDLSYPTVCSSTSSYVFPANSQIAKLTAVDWYLGTNPVGGTSLYRISLVNTTGTPTPTAYEMVRGVTSMNIAYLPSGGTAFVAASAITNWATVDAVQVTWVLQSTNSTDGQYAGTNTKPISRTFTATTAVRNRVN